jgi:hypothetical protein
MEIYLEGKFGRDGDLLQKFQKDCKKFKGKFKFQLSILLKKGSLSNNKGQLHMGFEIGAKMILNRN